MLVHCDSLEQEDDLVRIVKKVESWIRRWGWGDIYFELFGGYPEPAVLKDQSANMTDGILAGCF